VKLPTEARRDDSDISTAARHAIESNALFKPEKLSVTVADGWVTVRGQVEWNFEREEAEKVVRNLWGVKGVTNLVSVRLTATPEQVKQELEKAIWRTTDAEAQKITVDIQGSKVTLKGRVKTWAERQEAKRVAWMAPGVTQVDDQITIA